MGLLDAYQDSTDTALQVMAARPLEPEAPKPKRSAWSAIPRGVIAAASEVAGNAVDIASAYGQVSAAMGQNANPLLPDSPEDRKQRLDAFDKLKTDGIDFRADESRNAYGFARDLRPDPLTAGAAENIMFGLSKGLTKAIGAGIGLGAVGGAGVFGASEGLTTADDLAEQGVDIATRTKVGAVSAGLNTVGMALPIAGKTLAQTAGLIVAGGPASFVAQQAASRAILKNADYGAIAQQYDPLDPTGLALSVLLPAGFAAWAGRGSIAASMRAKPAAVAPQEHMDAAMVQNLTVARDAHEDGAASAIPEMIEEKGIAVYHGTYAEFEDFDIGKSGSGAWDSTGLISSNGRGENAGIYFTTSEDHAKQYGPIVLSRKVSLQNPANHDAQKLIDDWRIESAPEYKSSDEYVNGYFDGDAYAALDADAFFNQTIRDAKRGGHDGVIVDFGDLRQDNKRIGKVVIAFDSSQIAKDSTPATGAATPSDKSSADPHIASIIDRAEALRAEQPDMPVALLEDGTHARLADEIEAIRRQAREGTDTDFGADDAPLLQVAAECFLSLGAT